MTARVTDATGNVAWTEPVSVTVQSSAVPAPTLAARVGQDGVLNAADLSAITSADAQGRWSIGVQQALGAGQGGAGATAPVWQLANGRYAFEPDGERRSR